MLAGAMAGEVGVLFFFCSGNEFEEILTGVGVRRVRDLVVAAKKSSPCIICIDEINAIRGSCNPKDQQNMWRTLNQLLIEKNEFKQKEGVLLIEKINFPKSLDKERIKVLVRTGMDDITVFSDGIQNLIKKMNHILQSDGELMIASGTKAAIIPIGLGGYVVRRTLSQRSDDPRISLRP
ncbi:hypothetical protein V6N13_004956 [Hibiscus sabdariffa]|uniref:ATPase AAA-type core domain-containing protein n=1 Tax=Hibiscus sabdariffa TaxID=183260 RepID=A0ABR2S0C1_9ROSI